jgi:hypothetical protein
LMAERERLRELALDALAKLLANQRSTGFRRGSPEDSPSPDRARSAPRNRCTEPSCAST